MLASSAGKSSGKSHSSWETWLQIPNRADQGMDTRNGARSKLRVLRMPQPSTVRSRPGKW